MISTPNSRAFTKCKKIGEGTYGDVFELKSNGEVQVLKVIPIDRRKPDFTARSRVPEVEISR